MDKFISELGLAILVLLNFLENMGISLQPTVCFTVIIKIFLGRRYKEINILWMDNGETSRFETRPFWLRLLWA
jgi:hypothetical protein